MSPDLGDNIQIRDSTPRLKAGVDGLREIASPAGTHQERIRVVFSSIVHAKLPCSPFHESFQAVWTMVG